MESSSKEDFVAANIIEKEGKQDEYAEATLNQVSEILLQNILCVEKGELKGLGVDFYRFFHKIYKVKKKQKVVGFFKIYRDIKVNGLKGFSQTLIDVVDTKENVIDLFLNLQPRRKP